MRIFISADIEGVAGIANRAEADAASPDYRQFQELMTAEVVAACEGALAAGVEEIVIKDGHATHRNILLDRLPAQAVIVRDRPVHPHGMMFGIDEGCAAAVYIGYHDAAGTDSNPLAHSFSSRAIMRLLINGEAASEFTVNATTAAMLGVPSVFLSGDKGICAAAARLAPGIATVATSQGFGPATRAIAPARSRALIRQGVQDALTGLDARRATAPKGPWEVEIEFVDPQLAYRGSFFPGVDYPADRRLRLVRDDWFEVLRAFRFLW